MSIDEAFKQRVSQIVREIVGVDTTRDDIDMIETGRLDSLGLVELILAFERDLGVSVPIETLDIENFRTAASIAHLLDRLQIQGVRAHSPLN